MSSFEFRGLCGCPRTYQGSVVHRIQCRARVGTPVVFPPSKEDIAAAKREIRENFLALWTRAGDEYDNCVDDRLAGIDAFIEWAKQKLQVIALAQAVLSSTHGKADPPND